MPQAHQNCQLNSSCSHHERTYQLSRQECHNHIKTFSLIPATATMTGLTNCQGKNATSTSKLSASYRRQPPSEDLPSVKARMPQAHQNCQLHSSCSHHERTYLLSRQECHKHIKTVSFVPAAATMR